MKILSKEFCNRKRMKKRLASALAICLAAAQLIGCRGPENTEESQIASGNESTVTEEGNTKPTLGRYVETELNLSESGGWQDFCQLLGQTGGLSVPAINSVGVRVELEDYTVKDADYAAYPKALQEHLSAEAYLTDMAVADNGARMYTIFRMEGEGDNASYYYDKYFLSADGTETAWSDVGSPNTSVTFKYGRDGYFYVTDSWRSDTTRMYRVNAENGETEYLFEADGSVGFYAVCGDKIFMDMYDELQIYSLETLQKLDGDAVLEDAIAEVQGGNNGHYSFSYFLYPGEDDSIYVVTKEGLYRHVLYGSVMEQLIDGSLCSLGDISKMFVDMYVTEGESGMPVFYLLYDGAKLIRFVYDPQMPSVPETVLNVYSLYENNNIRRVISAYRKEHPEVYVSYEVGVSGTDGVTKDDALKILATMLASGEGPDILLMDDLPYSSYREKGVLMELDDVYEELKTKYGYFDNIIGAMRESGKLYTIPMTFYVPMLTGDAQTLSGIRTTEDMLAAFQSYKAPAGVSKAGLIDESIVLQCLSYTLGDSLVGEDGSLDREALREFLELAKALYETDKEAMTEEDIQQHLVSQTLFSRLDSGARSRKNYFQSLGSDGALMRQLMWGGGFTVGCQGGDIRYSLNEFHALLQSTDSDYMLMPGDGKMCLPISMLSVNASTSAPDGAKDFVQYALSDYLYDCDYLDGTPINRDALLKMEENPERDEQGNPSYEPYVFHAFSSTLDDHMIEFEIGWCRPEVYERYNAVLDSLNSVNLCESMLIDTLLEEGPRALSGERSIEETVNAIEKKVQLYLAE